MIQTPVQYNVPQRSITENGPEYVKDDFTDTNKSQVKVSVQVLSKENEKQATLPCPLDVAVRKGNSVCRFLISGEARQSV